METNNTRTVKIRHSISTRLLKIVLSIYIAVTIVVTVMHILIVYDNAKSDIIRELNTIQRTFEDSLSQALWHLDKDQLSVTVAGITELPTITGVEVYDLNGKILEHYGQVTEDKSGGIIKGVFWHEFPLKFKFGKDVQTIGIARVYSNERIVFDRIELGTVILVVSALIKTIVLFFLIIILFDRLLAKPLGRLAMEAEGIDPDDIKGKRIFVATNQGNELKLLENALNGMMDKIVVSMAELDSLNKNLESKVRKRTESLNNVIAELDSKQKDLKQEIEARRQKEKDLELSRLELQKSLEDLKQAQAQLIESEKMASLGGLVAGVAHEINTPVGLSLTGITHFQYLVEQIEKKYAAEDLEEDDFERFMSDSKELARSIVISLQRAADLVKSFKQVAVDQSHETIRPFAVLEYLNEILMSLRNRLKQTRIKVDVTCERSLVTRGYPGIWSQIITNLINNSLIHAYGPEDTGTIRISVSEQEKSLVVKYSDDGKGMSPETRAKIFDPFFTTNRENGGSGLGMNIIYNLVTQKMGGTIEVQSEPGQGATFTMVFGKELTEKGQVAV